LTATDLLATKGWDENGGRAFVGQVCGLNGCDETFVKRIGALHDYSRTENYVLINYPAASYGVLIGSYLNASRGGELNPRPPPAD
jgi:hypothetical protein